LNPGTQGAQRRISPTVIAHSPSENRPRAAGGARRWRGPRSRIHRFSAEKPLLRAKAISAIVKRASARKSAGRMGHFGRTDTGA
jgi:hypothetical protein